MENKRFSARTLIWGKFLPSAHDHIPTGWKAFCGVTGQPRPHTRTKSSSWQEILLHMFESWKSASFESRRGTSWQLVSQLYVFTIIKANSPPEALLSRWTNNWDQIRHMIFFKNQNFCFVFYNLCFAKPTLTAPLARISNPQPPSHEVTVPTKVRLCRPPRTMSSQVEQLEQKGKNARELLRHQAINIPNWN